MNAAQKEELRWKLVAQFDSDQPAVREAALGKYHSLREKMGWPRFVDQRGVTPEQLKAAEQNREKWEQAHAARVAENVALARRNAALVAHIALLSVVINWRKMTSVAVAAVVGAGGGFWWWSTTQAAADQEPVAVAEVSARAAIDGAFRAYLSSTRWSASESQPVIHMVYGVPYWLLVRGTVDARSISDARGNPIERHCLRLFSSEAVREPGGFRTPSPYLASGYFLRWPERAALCRSPGEKGYQ